MIFKPRGIIWKLFLCASLPFFICLPVEKAQAAPLSGMIPPDRLASWQGNVGVEGGIPVRTTQVDCTKAPYNAHADGTDTTGNIQACLNGIAGGQVAYLPGGTYTLTSNISMPSNKTLRGAGPDATILLFTASIGRDI